MFIIQIVDQNSLTKIMKSIDYPVKFNEICINLSKILKSSIILLNFIQKSSGSCFQSHKENWISWNPNPDKNRWNLHKFTKKIKFILILLNLSKNWVVCVFNLIKTIWISRNLNPNKNRWNLYKFVKKKIKIQSILVKLIEGSSGSCFRSHKKKIWISRNPNRFAWSRVKWTRITTPTTRTRNETTPNKPELNTEAERHRSSSSAPWPRARAPPKLPLASSADSSSSPDSAGDRAASAFPIPRRREAGW